MNTGEVGGENVPGTRKRNQAQNESLLKSEKDHSKSVLSRKGKFEQYSLKFFVMTDLLFIRS